MAKRLLILASIILFLCASCIIYDPYGGVALHQVPVRLQGIWEGIDSYGRITVTPYNMFGDGPGQIPFHIGHYDHRLLNERVSDSVYEVDYDSGKVIYRFKFQSWYRVIFTIISDGVERSEEYFWLRDVPRY